MMGFREDLENVVISWVKEEIAAERDSENYLVNGIISSRLSSDDIQSLLDRKGRELPPAAYTAFLAAQIKLHQEEGGEE